MLLPAPKIEHLEIILDMILDKMRLSPKIQIKALHLSSQIVQYEHMDLMTQALFLGMTVFAEEWCHVPIATSVFCTDFSITFPRQLWQSGNITHFIRFAFQ